MTTNRKTRGRPAKRSKIAGSRQKNGPVEISQKSNTRGKVRLSISPQAAEADPALLGAVGFPDKALPRSEEMLSSAPDLSPPPLTDAEAAAKALEDSVDQAKPKESDSKSRVSPGLPADAEAFLKPGVVSQLVVTLNNRLLEKRSVWSASGKEARDLGDALEKVLDKWFPSAGEWSPEAVLVALAAIYLIPRVPQALAARRARSLVKQPKQEAPPPPSPMAEVTALKDSRLEQFLA